MVDALTAAQDRLSKLKKKKQTTTRTQGTRSEVRRRWQERKRVRGQTQPDCDRIMWWRPLECEAYRNAVQRCLNDIEAGAMAGPEGATMIALRCRSVNAMIFRDSPKFSQNAFDREQARDWTSQVAGAWWQNNQLRPKRMLEESKVESELRVLAKLLDSAAPKRKIQWAVVKVAAHVEGEAADTMLKTIIFSLDPRVEGMARCVAPRFPHLVAELADNENPWTSGRNANFSDLLSPCLDLWLEAPSTRDERVNELMTNFKGAEYLVFFGNTFAEHLAYRRQELLHQVLLKLAKPPADGEQPEFYHYVYRVPSLARVALMGRGWRNVDSVHAPHNIHAKCSLTHMWSPQTQAEFLEKGITSTDMISLALIPRLEFVGGIAVAGSLLEAYPRQQDGLPDSNTFSGTGQSSGYFKDVGAEVERLFRRTGPPIVKNSFLEREADQILLNLGNADNAVDALSQLGKYASKFKRAKEAFIQAVPNLSPEHARRMLKEVGLGQQAGVSLQVQALRLVMELNVPNPLELYRTAFREGQCHRDIAVSILVKLATIPSPDFTPEEVRDMFNILTDGSGDSGQAVEPAGEKLPKAMSAANPTNHSYMATLFLKDVATTPKWSLPFLAEMIASIAVMPGCTILAVEALRKGNQGFATSEVLGAFTSVLRNARLAQVMHTSDSRNSKRRRRDYGEGDAKNSGYADMFRDLIDLAPGRGSCVVKAVKRLSGLHHSACDQKAIREFVSEVIKEYPGEDRGKTKTTLQDAYVIWVNVLRAGEPWGEHLAEMERELVSLQCGEEEYNILVTAVLDHMKTLKMSREKHGQQAVADLRALLEQVLSKFPMPPPRQELEPPEESPEVRGRIRLLEGFAQMVGQGCSMEALDSLLKLSHKKVYKRVVQRICESARSRLWWEEGPEHKAKEEDVAAAEKVARRALEWFADQDPAACLPTLVEYWPNLLRSDTECGALDTLLERFGKFPAGVHSIELVKRVVTQETAPPQTHFAHATKALEWLSSTFPRDALQLWPHVLNIPKLNNDQVTSIVTSILKLCEARNLDVPELTHAARVPAVLNLLASSSLPRARLIALSMLQELDLTGSGKEHASLLEILCKDTCVVVRSAALWTHATVFGNEPTVGTAVACDSRSSSPDDVDMSSTG